MRTFALHKIAMVALAIAAGSAGITTDALARGGGGGHGGGFGGGHMGAGFGGGHMGAGFGGGRGFAGSHFAGTRGRFGHDRRFGPSRFGSGLGAYYDYGCGYSYTYYNPYSCYLPTY